MFTALTDLEVAVGKAVAHVTEVDSYEWIVAFTDGTYLRFGVEFGWEGDTDELTAKALYDSDAFGEKGLKAGIVTQAEVDEYKRREADKERQQDIERRQREEAHERRVYQLLKEKYECQVR